MKAEICIRMRIISTLNRIVYIDHNRFRKAQQHSTNTWNTREQTEIDVIPNQSPLNIWLHIFLRKFDYGGDTCLSARIIKLYSNETNKNKNKYMLVCNQSHASFIAN